mgnify:FL=1|jgi:hypothetical protein|tara:strand:- start:1618 stop:2316 length:699 start_codon:yes stop_codon:yes gene_type:complete
MGVKEITENVTKSWDTKDLGRLLVEQIDKRLAHPQKSTSKNKFFVSAIGNPCDRYLWLHYNGMIPQKSIPANLQRIFGVGSSAEDRYNKYFGDMVIDREQVCRIDTPIMLSGRADFVLHHDGKLFVVELKTINQRGWENDLVNGPKVEHSTQLQCYLNMLNHDQGVILYENKNSQQIKTFVVNRNEDLWNGILSRGTSIAHMASPPRLSEVAAIHYNYCDCKLVTDEELGLG